ncbi:MAG: class I SAM-dependent methyltransferase [Polyangiaceae bacterium]|nr:class I SAM-dependent methyltransferase [Polyangiaceae bacterium]
MGLYEKYVFPRVCDLCMRQFAKARGELVASARGRVVELGAGTCENVRHLVDVEEYVAVEPAAGMRALAEKNLAGKPFPTRYLEAPGEQVPLDAGSFDTVLMTFVLCTILDPAAALREARRLLAPTGKLVVLEHVRNPDPSVARWQERIDPLWRIAAVGCELSRDSESRLRQAGFDTSSLEHLDVDAPKVFNWLIRGSLSVS